MNLWQNYKKVFTKDGREEYEKELKKDIAKE